MTAITRKNVNVYPNTYIYGIEFPITSTVLNVSLSVGDIRACLNKRAKVEEIIGKNKVVKLNYLNYDKDNSNAPTTASKDKITVTPVTPTEAAKPTVSASVKSVNKVTPNTNIKVSSVSQKSTKPIEKKIDTVSKIKVNTPNTVKKVESPISAQTINQVNTSTIKAAENKVNQIKK